MLLFIVADQLGKAFTLPASLISRFEACVKNHFRMEVLN